MTVQMIGLLRQQWRNQRVNMRAREKSEYKVEARRKRGMRKRRSRHVTHNLIASFVTCELSHYFACLSILEILNFNVIGTLDRDLIYKSIKIIASG